LRTGCRGDTWTWDRT